MDCILQMHSGVFPGVGSHAALSSTKAIGITNVKLALYNYGSYESNGSSWAGESFFLVRVHIPSLAGSGSSDHSSIQAGYVQTQSVGCLTSTASKALTFNIWPC